MTLVKARAAFEKAITDAVTDVDPTVKMIYDNIAYTTPGKTVKYMMLGINFGQSIMQNQGAAADYYLSLIHISEPTRPY